MTRPINPTPAGAPVAPARAQIGAFLNSAQGRNLVLGLIFLNAAILGLETYPAVMDGWGSLLRAADRAILILFTVEIVLRFYSEGSLKKYVSDRWNLFDLAIVSACWVPAAGSFLSVARILRVLRVLRAVSIFPELRRIVETLLKSLPAIGHIALLLALLIYAYAVAGTFLFRDTVPEAFGSLHLTLLTLFQVVTLEGWPDYLKLTLEHHWWAWIFFLTFILVGTFVIFNLFIGVIVGNLETAREGDFEKRVLAELAAIRDELSRR